MLELSDKPFDDELTIEFTPTETGTNFLVPLMQNGQSKGSGVAREDTLEFTLDNGTGKWTENITIGTSNFDGDNAHGEIEIVLTQPAMNANFQVKTAQGADRMTLMVQDSDNPLISISDADKVDNVTYVASGKFEAKFPITSSFSPYNDELDIKFLVSESGASGATTNFLDSAQYTANQPKTETVAITTDGNGNHTGMLTIHLVDDPNANSTTVTVVLQADSINYDIPTQASQRTATGEVEDPSYVHVSYDLTSTTNAIEIERSTKRAATLIVFDTTATYANIPAKLRRLNADVDNITFEAKWRLNNGAFTDIPAQTGNQATVNTPYGNWVISNSGNPFTERGISHKTSNAHFDPDDTAINGIPLGSRVRIELKLTVPNEKSTTTILIINHSRSSFWRITEDLVPTLREHRGTADFTLPKVASLNSSHSTLSEISFRAKYYDGSMNQDGTLNAHPEVLTTTTTESSSGLTGTIWSANTPYGKWLVGSHTSCFSTANCFEARFVPNKTAIDGISKEIFKAELELIVTDDGTETVGDTLTYYIDGRDLAVTLNDNNSQQISVTTNTSTLSDVAGTASYFKNTSDTISIAVEETTTNSDAPVTPGSMGTTANDDAGFSAKPYGADLMMGTWYFAEADTTTTTDPVDTNFQTHSRQVLFKPNLTNIKNLPDGDIRKSKLTITIQNDSDEDVATTTFEVTIEKRRIPILSFSIANATVTATEGGDQNGEMKFIVSANFYPGASTTNVKYTLSETGTNFLATPISNNADLTFHATNFSAEIPVALRDPDDNNTGPGTIEITLDAPTFESLYTIDPNNNSATATIVDTLLPDVSIKDVSPTFNGTDIVITLESTNPTSNSFTIKVKPENVTGKGNFLDETTGPNRGSGDVWDMPNVSFPKTSPDQTTFTDEIRIPTVVDPSLIEGEIGIELIADTSANRRYNLSTTKAITATAKVYRLTRLSIVADETVAKEGDLLTFTVTAENNPHQAPLTVNYTVQEVGAANFFNNTDISQNPVTQPPVPLTFEKDPLTDEWTDTISIQLRAIDTTKHDTNSTFTVELPQQSGDDSTYRVDTTSDRNIATVTISDNSDPTISITDAAPTYQGEMAVFTLTSQIEVTSGIPIKVEITTIGDFYDKTNLDQDGAMEIQDVTFTRATSTAKEFTYTWNVPTKEDDSLTSGEIQIEIVKRVATGGDYQPHDTNNTASVTVYNKVTLSVASNSATVREGEELYYEVTSDYKPPNSANTLNVNYTITEAGGEEYIDTNVTTTDNSVSTDLVFQLDTETNKWKSRIPVQLRARNSDASDVDGMITIVLGDAVTNPASPTNSDKYVLAGSNGHTATTTIIDNDTPIIKVVGNAANTFATQAANFTLESQIDWTSTTGIKVKVTNGSGTEFLEVTDGASGETRDIAPITFARVNPTDESLPYVYNLAIPTQADANNNTGTIGIELIDDSTTNDYNIDENNKTASVLVYNTVTLSVRAESANVREGDSIKFILSGDYKPPNDENVLNVNYTMTEDGTANFLNVGFKGTIGPTRLVFTKPEGATEWTSEIDFDLRTADTISSGEGTIKLELMPGVNYTPAAGEAKIATISVRDTSIPVISIADTTSLTFNGTDAVFMLTSTILTGEFDLTIRPSNKTIGDNTGDFLAPVDGLTSGNDRTVKVNFTTSTTFSLAIKTQIDPTSTIGEIQVELIDGSDDNAYNIDQNNNIAVARVYRIQNLEISSAVTRVIEGTNELTFTLTTNLEPEGGTLTVFYGVTEENTNFISSAIKSADQSPTLPFSRTGDSITATLRVSLLNDDPTDPDPGTITVTLKNPPADSGSNYEVGSNNEVRIRSFDSSNIPTLSISDPSGLEGADTDQNKLIFNVELNKALLEESLTVQYQVVSYTGDAIRAIRGSDFELTSPSELNFLREGNLSLPIEVDITGDDTIESNEQFQIEISVPDENALIVVEKSIGVGTIQNDDEDPTPRPFIYVKAETRVIDEGDPAVFIVGAIRPDGEPTSPIRDIGLNISQGDKLNYIGWRVPRVITIPAEADNYSISITTIDDEINRGGGLITATITPRDEFIVNPEDVEAEIEVNDNDIPTSQTDNNEPRISVADVAVSNILQLINDGGLAPQASQAAPLEQPIVSVMANNTEISEGELAEFNIIANRTLTKNLIVTFAVSQSGDFLTPQVPTQAQIFTSTNQTKVFIATQDDQHAEADGTITLQIQPNRTYQISTQSSATVAVSDAVDRQHRKDEISQRTSEILPEIHNLVGSDALATTAQRIQQAQDDSSSSTSYRINGAQGIRQIITTSGEMINSEPESLRSILGNSEFAFKVYSEDYLTNPVSVWGLGELKAVNSTGGTGTSGWQGDAFTGHLGFDTKLSPNTLMGMTTSVVDMDAEYALAKSNEFLFQSRNTSFNPYLNWTSPNSDAQLQTIVGYGLGTIDIKQPNYQYETLQSYSSNYSFNGRKRIYSSDSFLTGGTSTLNLVGESWMTRLQVTEKPDIIDAVNLSAQHHRLAVDASHNISFASGSSIRPSLSVGLLHDGKNEDALQGVEFRNGVSYSNAIGLNLSGDARMVFEPTSQSRLWNLNGSLDFDYSQDQLGVILAVSGTYSHGQENYTDLLNMSILDGGSSNSMNNTINTELQYGLTLCSTICSITPYAGYDFDADGADNSRLGTRLSVGSLLNFEFEHSHNPGSDETTSQRVQFNSRLSW